MAKTNRKHTKKRGRSYHGRGTVKSRPTKSIKSKGKKTGGKRPSARAEYNAGCPIGEEVFYNNKWHELALRTNGSPYWKPVSKKKGCYYYAYDSHQEENYDDQW